MAGCCCAGGQRREGRRSRALRRHQRAYGAAQSNIAIRAGVDDQPHSATAIANEDSNLLMLTRMNFERLTQEEPVLCNRVLTQIARLLSLRLRQTTGILVDHLDHDV